MFANSKISRLNQILANHINEEVPAASVDVLIAGDPAQADLAKICIGITINSDQNFSVETKIRLLNTLTITLSNIAVKEAIKAGMDRERFMQLLAADSAGMNIAALGSLDLNSPDSID